MMMTQRLRARWAAAACLVAPLVLTQCHVKDKLLEPQNPGLVDESAVGSAPAALALRVGAIGRLRNVVNAGEPLWGQIGHITDEYKNADFQITRQDVDRRTLATNNGAVSATAVQQPRGFLRDAIDAMVKYNKDSTSMIGELYMGIGFMEMTLAENWCNGMPLSRSVRGEIFYGPSLTNVQVFDSSLAKLDSALAINTKTDAASNFVRQATLILKARVLVDKGQFAAAAALVPVSAVPTSYQYVLTTSAGTNGGLEDNGHWQFNVSVRRVTLGDSFDIVDARPNVIKGALPFASAADPRVPVRKGGATEAEDGITPMFFQQIWSARDDPIPMVSGIDARLIEAEARLNASDIPGMMVILNGLRATTQRIGNFNVPVMPALATPANQQAAIRLFFREKGFWTFGRGQRLSDMRRLMRHYGFPEDQAFPTGVYSFGGNAAGVYGTDVNFPIHDNEKPNPNFKGCIDRKP